MLELRNWQCCHTTILSAKVYIYTNFGRTWKCLSKFFQEYLVTFLIWLVNSSQRTSEVLGRRKVISSTTDLFIKQTLTASHLYLPGQVTHFDIKFRTGDSPNFIFNFQKILSTFWKRLEIRKLNFHRFFININFRSRLTTFPVISRGVLIFKCSMITNTILQHTFLEGKMFHNNFVTTNEIHILCYELVHFLRIKNYFQRINFAWAN